MELMEQFLSNLPDLKHLELNLHVLNDLIDGKRWEILANCLKTFRFKFYVQSTLNLNDLDSFRTSFWLEEKHWYIDYWNNCIFSLNQSSPIDIDIYQSSFNWFTQSEDTINNMYINQITIQEIPIKNINCFTHVKILDIKCSISREMILSMVDLKQIEHLSVLKMTDLLNFLPFEFTIPNVYALTIKQSVTFSMIQQFRSYQFEQIRKLNIDLNFDEDVIFKLLFYRFPNIEYFTYQSLTCSKDIMIHLIDGFPCLLNASIFIYRLPKDMKSNFYPNQHTIIENSHRLKKNNFTYRIRKCLDIQKSFSIDWWIAPQPLYSTLVVHLRSGLHYILYQVK
ncbi:unnamed protein product [Rotaria sordida]|uniref:Uncharacterized protein n=1 Tax=Rotaria sordida TaxID=392033 RepID=A0A813VH02_9BILA|nr:unnamed protein product [Rotaria sordida]